MERQRFSDLIRILRDHYNPREHGWMWVAIEVPGAERGVLNQIEGEQPDADTVIRFLAHLLEQLGDVEMLIAVCRPEGRPYEADRLIWRGLRTRFDGGDTRIVDMVVFGRDAVWSMREEDVASNAVA